MKPYRVILLLLGFSIFSLPVNAQESVSPKALVAQGVALNDSGKYAEAIVKYKDALLLDSTYKSAYYEIGFTLFSSGKENDAIPYLEKLLKLDSKYAGAYDMLGSIYDDNKQPEKAIEYYLKGLKADPGYQRLHFNLAITYYKIEKYSESEKHAVEAIKLDPKHASSQRVYAMATYKQDKRGVSLLAWCSFLLREPQSKRSAEAYRHIEKLINYGITPTGEKSVTINVSTKDMEGPNFLMPMTIINATSDKKGFSQVDSLALQLKSVFEISEEFTRKKADSFFKAFYGDYFKALAGSENMPAFARLVSLTAYKEENLKWFKENDDKLKALNAWVAATKREL